MKIIMAALVGSAFLSVPASVLGAEQAPDTSPVVSADAAITYGLVYKADIFSNISGGIERGTTVLGNLDATVELDLDSLMGWEGVSVGLHGIASHGGKPNGRLIGSSQGVDNIEVDTNTAKILQAWVQKQWMDDRLSVLLGLYDLNSEFYVSHSTGIFLHPSPGIGSELAQTGLNGPSVFPTTSVSLRLRYRPTSEVYAQAVVLDGVPGDPNNPHGTHIEFNKGDGSLRVAEVGYIPQQTGEVAARGLPPTDKYAVGAWSYTGRFADLVDVDGLGDPLMRKGNSGFYVLAEKILGFGSHSGSHTDGFVRYGQANADLNQFSRYFQTGLVFTGMTSGRPKDQIGVSYSTAWTGSKYRLAAFNNGQEATRHESIWELTYRRQVTSWLAVQPDIQYVIHPGTDAQVKHATVLGLRVVMSTEE